MCIASMSNLFVLYESTCLCADQIKQGKDTQRNCCRIEHTRGFAFAVSSWNIWFLSSLDYNRLLTKWHRRFRIISL
jgi:hypothetical protein